MFWKQWPCSGPDLVLGLIAGALRAPLDRALEEERGSRWEREGTE
jgi:hypothetical protein